MMFMCFRSFLAAVALLLTVGLPAAAAANPEVFIPEPMVFDLVRPLGAEQGELEINTLFIQPLESGSGREDGSLGRTDEGKLLWAPEIEATALDGLGLEFELPFEGLELESVKVAVQATLGVPVERHYIHGLQFIAERFLEPTLWELSLLYIPGYRIDEVWSLLGMVGARTTLGSDHDHTEALVNLSIFADFGESTTVGLETNLGSDLEGSTHVLLMPQVHYEMSFHWMIQAGAGARFVDGDGQPELAARAIYTF